MTGDADLRCAIDAISPVLISGGSGSDREALARHIHAGRGNPTHVFTRVDCAEVDRLDILSAREGGTLFLDHVHSLGRGAQALLAGHLEGQDRHPIIAGTGRDLAAAVHEGSFSATLFYRLNVIHLVIPPRRRAARRQGTGSAAGTARRPGTGG